MISALDSTLNPLSTRFSPSAVHEQFCSYSCLTCSEEHVYELADAAALLAWGIPVDWVHGEDAVWMRALVIWKTLGRNNDLGCRSPDCVTH